MQQLGLTAKAVNAVTKAEADANDLNIWKIIESDITVILISPEMLSSPGFRMLIDSKVFQLRLYAMAMDEVHLLKTWGETFRPAFRQIGFMRARFSQNLPMLALTATMQDKNMKSICDTLGFQDNRYHLLRRSNARPDIQLIFRTLNANPNTERFTQLDWVLKAPGKTLIFCSSIRFGFKLAIYLWHLDPSSAATRRTLRLFNSLNSPEYNRITLELLRGSDSSMITIATDKLSVGVDISDFQTVVITDPKDLDDLWQKAGRVGRDRTKIKNPRVIVYILSAIMKAMREFNGNPTPQQGAGRKKKKKKALL